MALPGLRGLDLGTLCKRAVRHFLAYDIATYAAAVTYHLLFSFLPFLIFFIALLGFLDLSNLFDWLRQRSQAFLLPETMQQINLIFDQLQQHRPGLLSFAVAGVLWAASSGMRSMMKALNVIYGVKEARPLWKRYFLSLLYTLLLGVLLAVAATLAAVSPEAIAALSRAVGMKPFDADVWAWWLRWPAIVLLLTVAVATVYRVGPDVEQRFKFVTPGAFLVVLTWMAATLAFNFYVRNISAIGILYGSVGTILVLLLYFFIGTSILLFGAVINVVIEHHAPTGKNPGEKRLMRG